MKILLIRRGAIGDVLMTTPLVRQLRNMYGYAQIDYCTAKSSVVALKNNKNIDNIIALDDNVFSVRGVFQFIKFILSWRKKYDQVFILGKNLSIILLCKLFICKNSKLIGFARGMLPRYILNKFVIYDNVERYQVLYYLDLLMASKLAIPNYSSIAMDLYIADEDKQIIQARLKHMNLINFVVVTNSGGNNEFEKNGIRMLPENKILELLQKLNNNTKVLLMGGANDKVNYDRYCSELSNCYNIAGELSLAQSTYLLNLTEHFYVTDCGAMHMGLIAGIEEKMTCFFGPTNPKHILPSDTKCNIIWEDGDIYDKNYQLYGRFKKEKREYFQRIDINESV